MSWTKYFLNASFFWWIFKNGSSDFKKQVHPWYCFFLFPVSCAGMRQGQLKYFAGSYWSFARLRPVQSKDRAQKEAPMAQKIIFRVHWKQLLPSVLQKSENYRQCHFFVLFHESWWFWCPLMSKKSSLQPWSHGRLLAPLLWQDGFLSLCSKPSVPHPPATRLCPCCFSFFWFISP